MSLLAVAARVVEIDIIIFVGGVDDQHSDILYPPKGYCRGNTTPKSLSLRWMLS